MINFIALRRWVCSQVRIKKGISLCRFSHSPLRIMDVIMFEWIIHARTRDGPVTQFEATFYMSSEILLGEVPNDFGPE